MRVRSASLALSTVTIVLGVVCGHAAAAQLWPSPPVLTLVQDDGEPEPTPAPAEPDPGNVFEPKTYPATPEDVEACMKTWDAQTGMSKEEYRRSCQQTLKYFPEQPN
ncbi:hypothetical protein [Hyphomicrobium sp. CS1GBMeth3]|uniref:hypothetical protein n=1 Tax=Hyphomicrobium sp. CS1GBMeth3 TaxID=1892845 RepID=UPI0009303C1C|nr:hypothetical protein [Hyphomicrobium sp. CS1GBMeth3]